MIQLFVIVFLGLLASSLWRHFRYLSKWDHLPGHSSWTSLPLIGHMYRLGTTPIESLHALNRRFGDVFRLDSGPWPAVWLCDYDQITEAMKKEVFSARPHHLIPGIQQSWANDKDGCFGIVFASGKRWAEQRKFLSQYLASSKDSFDDIIGDEASRLCNQVSSLIESKSGVVSLIGKFSEPTNRVLWRTVTGKPIEDKIASWLNDVIRDVFRMAERAKLSHLLQMTTSFAAPISKALGLENIIDKKNNILDFLADEKARTLPDPEGNFMERFMVEAGKAAPGSSFYGEDCQKNLESSLASVLLAGTDTVSAFLEWFVLYMTAFPDVQEKFFREIETVIGSRSATLKDRACTHYVEATLQEITRHCPHLALTVQHYTTGDTKVGGYFIPKGTQVYYFSGAVFYNPDFFKDPATFRPERFIDAKGEFVSDERVIYFGTGKRRCVGEILGRAEQYLFSVALVQAFKFGAPEGQRPELGYIPGLNMHANQFSSKITPRF